MKEIILGKHTRHFKGHNPDILCPVKRTVSKAYGFDLWRCYEFSWLNSNGKPQSAILELIYPSNSKNIIEAKSLKLYLNGLAFTRFESPYETTSLIKKDLSILETEGLEVELYTITDCLRWPEEIEGLCIDDLDFEMSDNDVCDLPATDDDLRLVKEFIYTNLLLSFCPITGQPDWATVVVDYTGPKINHESLLRYICSFRNHQAFAEECCEKIFNDIIEGCRCERLMIGCLYTRRGGIDINPFRSSHELTPEDVPLWRLPRQ